VARGDEARARRLDLLRQNGFERPDFCFETLDIGFGDDIVLERFGERGSGGLCLFLGETTGGEPIGQFQCIERDRAHLAAASWASGGTWSLGKPIRQF
jgi:hypothetical protein